MFARSKKIKIGFVLIILTAFTTTYASKITINSGKTLEFGQGIITFSACSQEVNVDFTANANPQLDADVELWLEKLIAETRLQSNLFSSTTTEVVDLTAKKSETNSAPSKKRKRSSVGSRVEKVTGQKEITRT